MGIAQRIAMVFRIKANKVLDRAEDPREVMDYSYERQQEMLTKMRRGLADVATSRKRIELQIGQLQQSAEKLHGQAEQAVAAGREDLAREALARRSTALEQVPDLQAQRDALRADEDKLTAATHRLQTKVEAFRTRKESIKAGYTAAEAQTKVNEAVSGISEEMGDVGLAMQRAEDKTVQMQSRAQAMDELLASGALDDATAAVTGRDDLQAALNTSRADTDIERELAAIKGRSGAGQQAIEGQEEQR